MTTVFSSLVALLLAAAAARVKGASPLCDVADGQQGLQVTWSNIDSSVDWSPRFAGAAGEGNVVLVASTKRTLYRSTDDGRTFNAVALPSVPGAGAAEGHGVQFTANAATQFYAYGRINGSFAYWGTRDSGASWSLHWPNAEQILWIEPHPLLAQVALGLAAQGPQAEFAQSTYLTTDFGLTWVRIGGNTTFQTVFGCESIECPYRSAIIYQQAPVGAPWDDCRSGLCNLHRVLFDPNKPSASALAKPTQIGDSINGLGEVHWPWYNPLAASLLFVSSRICDNTDGCHGPEDYKQRVRYSLNGGITWTRALFPFDATHTMRFVTSESGVLLVGVRHHDQATEAEYGDLYVSSTAAVEEGLFVLSLRHVYMSPKMWWENSMFSGQLAVERSAELDGVLIANRYRSLSDGTADTSCLQSVITFDLGATWSLIKAPRGACSTGDCFLHVLLNSNDFPTAYSPSDAVGVWITSGMVGACLDPHAASYGTYYTSDGGATWLTMSTTPLIYEVSNHGALVVGSPIKALTNEFTYTLDAGASFRTCTFNASTSVMVNNILTRSFNARNFLMEGRLAESADSPGFLAHFDFDSVHLRDCTDADFEQWSPGKCLLGEHVVWSRRVPTAQCHNPTEHRVSKLETPCDCTDGDWECDFCYELGPEGKCVPQTSKVCQAIVAHPETLFCVGNETQFSLSDGYRLEPNNRCKNGVQHGKSTPCPEKGSDVRAGGTDNTGVIVGIVAGCTLIALVIAAGIIVYFKKRGKVAYQSMVDEH